MNPHLERAELLVQQSRFDLAEEHLRRALADDPGLAVAHGLMALCMIKREAFKDATDSAEQAIALAPDLAFAYYVLSCVMLARNRREEAETAAKQAIELNPYDADLHLMLANVYLAQRRWTAALEQANEGLKLDADHIGCANARGMALVSLGRKAEAANENEGVLARDPDDAFSHSNRGWTALHQGDPRKALEHFREALRLDPNLEFAKVGTVEALKARYLIYRLMLRWFLWMSRMGAKGQWAFLIVLYLTNRFLGELAERHPQLAPFIWPVILAIVAFVLLSWAAEPLFNFVIHFSRYGRRMLKSDQIIAAYLTAVFVAAAPVLFIYSRTEDDELYRALFEWMALAVGIYVMVIAGLFRVPLGPRRWVMAAGALFLFGLATYAFWLMFAAPHQRLPDIAKSMFLEGKSLLFDVYVIGVLCFGIAVNVVSMIPQKR
jgi:tetratricopeptide (TPR) repeat protein